MRAELPPVTTQTRDAWSGTAATNITAEHAWSERALELYKQLHQQPELSGREYRTARVLASRLRGLGFKVHEHIGETGVVGMLHNGPGPSIALRAEMDGLAVEERTGVPYASTATGWLDGRKHPVSHACGHDVHMASMIAAVEKLVAARNTWSGSLTVIFQPAEETGCGAQRMLDDGLEELVGQPEVLLAQHTSALPAGVVTLRAGPVSAAGKNIDVLFHGEGGHAAYSGWETNPVAAATRYVELLRRHFAESGSMKLTVGALSAGTGHNTIPETATIRLGLRATSDKHMARLVDEARAVLDSVGGIRAGTPRPDFNKVGQFPALVNDEHSAVRVHEALTRAEIPTYWQTERTWACEDLGTMAMALDTPVVYWFLGVSDPALFGASDVETLKKGSLPEHIPANHSGSFAPHPGTVLAGAHAMESAALAFLGRTAEAGG